MGSSTPSPLSRRSFSLPVSSPDPQVDILFTLPSARIVSFTTSTSARTSTGSSRPGLSGGLAAEEESSGSLQWVSRYESTIAIGPLSIYRAPGSVAFLNCASALKPILPKSQAWCVDGDSKFVLQIRRPQYWRIEVSNKTAEERVKVDELKRVLGEVLLFEKTPCPFQRNFTVKLPEAPKTPVVKRPWKPLQGPKPENLPSPEGSIGDNFGNSNVGKRASSSSPLRTSSLVMRRRNSALELAVSNSQTITLSRSQRTTPSISLRRSTTILEKTEPILSLTTESRDHDMEPPETIGSESSLHQEPSIPEELAGEPTVTGHNGFDESDNFSDATDDTNTTPRGRFPAKLQNLVNPAERLEKPQTIQSYSRAVTAPPLLSLVTSPPSKQSASSPQRSSAISELDSSFSSSVESFHSVQSWHSPLAPPSPPFSDTASPIESYPYPHENITLPKRPQHAREVSELTITPEASRVWDVTSTGSDRERRDSSPAPKTPILENDVSEKSDEEQFEVATPPTVRSGIRHRATTSSNSRRRALSPLPAAVNLFSPTTRRPRRLQTARHLPTAIIQKTCEILLSPPSHLLNLMLSIASKIAAGEWRGFLSGYGEAVHWDFEEEYGGDDLFEDDYGISLPHNSSKAKKPSAIGGSWEVD